jgi:hypothetical protein
VASYIYLTIIRFGIDPLVAYKLAFREGLSAVALWKERRPLRVSIFNSQILQGASSKEAGVAAQAVREVFYRPGHVLPSRRDNLPFSAKGLIPKKGE